MCSKKITAVLLAVGIVASTSALFSQINIKGALADTIKQNVVYTKDDTQAVSQDNDKISSADEKVYKEKSLDVLKKYFNISVEENENFKFSAEKMNEKTLDEEKPEERKETQDLYDKNEISKEQYDKQMDNIDKNTEQVEKLKRGMIQAAWADDNRCYIIDFNENTKEVEFAFVSNENDFKQSDTKLKLSEDEFKNIAENFIKNNKIAGIDNPKCILAKGWRAFYQDENDPNKKAEIGIDLSTGKVVSFAINSYADVDYNEVINTK